MKTMLWLILLLWFFGYEPEPGVKAIDFTADCENGQLWLNWTTPSGLEVDYFEIQRSIDGQDWILLDVQKAITISNISTRYEFRDNFPVAGKTFYRLQSVDFEGSKKNTLTTHSNCAGL